MTRFQIIFFESFMKMKQYPADKKKTIIEIRSDENHYQSKVKGPICYIINSLVEMIIEMALKAEVEPTEITKVLEDLVKVQMIMDKEEGEDNGGRCEQRTTTGEQDNEQTTKKSLYRSSKQAAGND